MKRRLAIAALVFTGCGAAFVPPAGADNGANNIVQVKNQTDTAAVARSRVQLAEDANNDVEEGNGAIADASCANCQTIAAAIQIVVVESPNVTYYHPQNGAVAVNQGCSFCDTRAYADQIVLTPYHQVVLSADTRQAVVSANSEASQIVQSNVDYVTMGAELKDLANRLAATVQADIDRQSSTPTARDDRDDERVG